jgi:hypothetical protein
VVHLEPKQQQRMADMHMPPAVPKQKLEADKRMLLKEPTL